MVSSLARHFFFIPICRRLRCSVYETAVEQEGDIVPNMLHIQHTSGIFERLQQSLLCRYGLCNEASSRHFEQRFLKLDCLIVFFVIRQSDLCTIIIVSISYVLDLQSCFVATFLPLKKALPAVLILFKIDMHIVGFFCTSFRN